MTQGSTARHRSDRRRASRCVGAAAAVIALAAPMAIAPAAQAETTNSLGAIVDQALVTGAGGPGGGKVDSLGSLGSAVLDGVSNIVRPKPAATRSKARHKKRHKTRHKTLVRRR